MKRFCSEQSRRWRRLAMGRHRRFIAAALLALLCALPASGQGVPVSLSPVARQQFFSSSGLPLASGCVSSFQAGTTTPSATYSDIGGVNQNQNPLTLDGGGFATIYLANQSYKIQVNAAPATGACASNNLGSLVWTQDQVSAYQVINSVTDLFFVGVTSDPGGSAGEIGYRSDIPCFRSFTVVWDCFVRLGDVQTLTNKTLTTPVINGTTTGTGIQGSDAKLLSAGTVSASSGVTLCTDANGGATTSSCGAGVAKFDQLNNTASIPTTTLYAVPSNGAGTYRLNCFAVVTQAASTSSTLPGCSMNWTDQDTGVVVGANNTVASTANQVGTNTPIATAPTLFFEVKASTNITFNFSGYASSGATPMAYAVHVKLEYLGP